jgi:hypothetical protein
MGRPKMKCMMSLWGLSDSDSVIITNTCALGVEVEKLFIKEVSSSLFGLEYVDVPGTP